MHFSGWRHRASREIIHEMGASNIDRARHTLISRVFVQPLSPDIQATRISRIFGATRRVGDSSFYIFIICFICSSGLSDGNYRRANIGRDRRHRIVVENAKNSPTLGFGPRGAHTKIGITEGLTRNDSGATKRGVYSLPIRLTQTTPRSWVFMGRGLSTRCPASLMTSSTDLC